MRTRPSFIVAVCLFAACLGSGCGSKSQPPSSDERKPETSGSPQVRAAPATDAKPVTADNRPLLVTFGDSLTQGVEGKSYPAFLQDLLDAQGFRYRVDNQGVSGDTTTDGLARIENVIAVKPALVVVEFGGNDGLRGVPVESTRDNLDQILARLTAAKIPLVLAGITLPPNFGPEYVKPFTAVFPDLAKKYRVRYMPFLLVHVFDKPGLMRSDGIHPTEPGNRIVAKDVFELVKPLLKKGQEN
jgi:acyl-CoA thioesterase-1